MASKNVFGILPGCLEEESLRLYPSKFVGPMKAINGVPIVRIVVNFSNAQSIRSVVQIYCTVADAQKVLIFFTGWYSASTRHFFSHEDLVPSMIFDGIRCINPWICHCSAMRF